MKTYALSHLADQVLLRSLKETVARDRATTAELLALIAEVDERRLYVPAGYPSMYLYCVQELRLSEDAAYKRIQAARAARQYPAFFGALAEGRLHLTGLGLLAPHLTAENAAELLGAAEHQTKSAIEEHLASRFPRTEMLPLVEAFPGARWTADTRLAPAQVGAHGLDLLGAQEGESAGAPGGELAPAQVGPLRSRVAPLARERFSLHLTIGQGTYDNLCHAQALASHQIPSGDLAEVIDRALKAYIRELEKARFAATDRPRRGARRQTASARHIPAQVKRAVWERDGGQCTFVSDAGHRCASRKLLQFDHIEPVARGGRATVTGMRLRCRAHNQYEAERVFGAGFMSAKRESAQRAAEQRRAAARFRATGEQEGEARVPNDAPAVQARERDIMPALRELGFRADEARRAMEHCESIPDASLEQRVRVALRFLAPRPRPCGMSRSAS